jgi:hypothetical protein
MQMNDTLPSCVAAVHELAKEAQIALDIEGVDLCTLQKRTDFHYSNRRHEGPDLPF